MNTQIEVDVNKMSRSDLYHGIMAASIFPSLADVLTEPFGINDEYFGPLDLSLANMDLASAPASYERGLEEHDFLNNKAFKLEDVDSSIMQEDLHIQELSQPGDLLVPMWFPETEQDPSSVFIDDDGVGLIEYEIMASCDDVDPPMNPNFYSEDSTGEASDYSSDTSSEPGTDILSSNPMIKLENMDMEPLNLSSIGRIKDTFAEMNGLKMKTETANLPDESVLNPFDMCTNDDIHSHRVEYEADESSDCSVKADDNRRKRPGRKKGQTSSVYHLWEFIRDLLHDPKHCPSIIKWENEEEGIFRVIKSMEVAKQWGSMKKNKTKMTYEKLSRSLRYSRKEGYFQNIPKNCGYPKKLCFKFGPKSHGWKKS